MSGGYASRLSEYKNKGVCGLPEYFETSRSLTIKLNKLAKLIGSSEKVVVLTGAGISTAAGIQDFRGPRGIWTVESEAQGEAAPNKRRRVSDRGDTVATHEEQNNAPKSEPFACVAPTFTHRAIENLVRHSIVQHVITQNVDGLHLRSGLPRSALSILHGDCFVEKCEECGREYFRDFDIGGVSFKKTGRFCNGPQALEGDGSSGCGGALRDTILDWDDELPEEDFVKAESACETADLVICLGTSLRIVPAGQLPLKAKQFVIVNLQQTPYDQKASLVIHHYVDTVMKMLLDKLDMSVSYRL